LHAAKSYLDTDIRREASLTRLRQITGQTLEQGAAGSQSIAISTPLNPVRIALAEAVATVLYYMFYLTQHLAQRTFGIFSGVLHLKESLQPPDLENALANYNTHLEDTPPFYACVRALSGVAVGSLAHDDVALLVLYLGEKLGELLD
jgi:hypothetical protein